MDPKANTQQRTRRVTTQQETDSPATYRILLISSRHIGSAGLYAMLRNDQQVEVVAHVSDAPTAVEAVERLKPDAVLVPSDVAGMTVVELAHALRQLHLGCKVGVFSQAVDHDLELALVQEEVDSYILWNQVDAEMLAICLRAYRKNLRVICVEAADELFAGPEQRRRLRDAGLQFDARERAVMTGVARGLTAKQIAHRAGLAPRTVERIRSELEHALGAANLQDLRRKAQDLGFGE